MLGVIAKLTIKEGKVDEAIDLIKTLMAEVANEKGTLAYTLNRDPSNPNGLIFMERYKDKAALDHHSSTPHFKAFLLENLKSVFWRKSNPYNSKLRKNDGIRVGLNQRLDDTGEYA